MIQKTATGALSAGTADMLYCCQQKEEMPHMKLTFLGTGAGEGYPGLWCKCPHCDYARKHGGKNIRANSCAVIDEDMLLDVRVLPALITRHACVVDACNPTADYASA